MKPNYKKIRRNVFGFLSFSTALFVFQACYGAPMDRKADVLLKGTVLADSTNTPVQGIKVSVNGSEQVITTDSAGNFNCYIPAARQYALSFSDADTNTFGHFQSKDTVMTTLPEAGFTIHLPANQ